MTTLTDPCTRTDDHAGHYAADGTRCYGHRTTTPAPIILPTVPGMVRGIVATDPLTIQCGECGTTEQQTTERTGAAFLILSGYRFHTHEADSPRRCPACHARALGACPRTHA